MRRITNLAPLLAVASIIIATSACVPEDEGGSCINPPQLANEDINGGATLRAGCYEVRSSLTLEEGLLTIEPGVEVIFFQDVGLTIRDEGRLHVRGKASSPVQMYGSVPERGHWKGLYFHDTDANENSLEYLELSHAGSSKWHGGGLSRGGIYVRADGVRLSIANSTFAENDQAAIVADGIDSDLRIDDSAFARNQTPIWIHPNRLGRLDGLTFTDNDNQHIRTSLGGSAEDVVDDQTVRDLGVPYLVSNTIDIDASVTVEAGTVVVFDQDAGLDVREAGRLSVNGNPDQPVVMTGLERERGFWKGLYFAQSLSGENVLDHVVIEYAGSDQWHGGGVSRGGIYARGDGVALRLHNVTLRENDQAGFVADGEAAQITIESSEFVDNEMPMWTHANLVGDISADTSVAGNDKSYVLVGRGSTTNVVVPQTWNTLDAPYRFDRTVKVTAALVLSPGMTLEFAQDVGMQVDEGSLVADASNGAPIRFVPAGEEPIKGFWKGVSFHRSLNTTNKLANVDIMYGGSSGWHGGSSSLANLHLRGGDNKSQVALDDVRLTGSEHWGLSVESEAIVSPCEGLKFQDNGIGDDGGHLHVDEDAIFACQ
jgi:hypothetical protein